jgi:hypothetical protein
MKYRNRAQNTQRVKKGAREGEREKPKHKNKPN